MKKNRPWIVVKIDERAVRPLMVVMILAGTAIFLSSEQLTMTATYPSPVGVYNQIITTGNAGATPANTILVRNAGNVGVGTASPVSKLDVAGGVRIGDQALCDATTAGSLRFNTGAVQVCVNSAWTGFGATSGMVAAFNLAACPSGWIPANGASGTPDLRGEFVRGLDGGRGIDAGRALNSWQAGTSVADHATASGSQLYVWLKNTDGVDGTTPWSNGGVGGGAGTAPYYVVRPRNVALLYCQKS